MHSVARTAFRTALAAVFVACGDLYGVNCTLIGSAGSGLTVRFASVTSPITRVEVSPYRAGEQPAYVADCARLAGGCDNGVFFPEYRAPSAAITVFTESGSQSGTIALQYHKSYPNGPRCDPEDVNATVIIDVRNGGVSNVQN